VLQGGDVLDLNEKQMSSLWRRADALLASDPQGAEVVTLQELFQETHYLPTDARQAIAACEAGNLFFSVTNFRLMTYLPMSSNAKGLLSKLTLATLDSHISKKVNNGPAEDLGTAKTSRRQRDALKKLAAIKRDAERLKR